MNTLTISPLIYTMATLVLTSIGGCQSQQLAKVETQSQTQVAEAPTVHQPTKKAPLPCKHFAPPVKDKTKIKDMRFKEGKLTPDMTTAEINSYVDAYIAKKQNKPCKPHLKSTY